MNDLKLRCISLLIAIFVAFGMVTAVTGEVNAASGKITVTVYSQAGENKVYAGERGSIDVSYEKGNEINSLPIKSVKIISGKTKAKVKKATVTGEYGEKQKVYYVVGKKAGKVKISVKYKLKGKVKTKLKTITVKPCPNAVESLEINGSKKVLTGEKKFVYNAECKKTKVNVKITPAEGWEITDAYGYKGYMKNKEEKTVWIDEADSKVKDGTAISFKSKYTHILLSVDLEKDGKVINYQIDLHR
ncbi:MAG: hypothetical protein IJJ06_11580 [Mogibacterium sp.]|nr:hypothetical protein [Mogibacterium sp.]